MERTFVGFGFGAIQGGLFLPEAHRSGNFSRLVVSEIDADAVAALRAANGAYACNVATATGVVSAFVDPIPASPTSRQSAPVSGVREGKRCALALITHLDARRGAWLCIVRGFGVWRVMFNYMAQPQRSTIFLTPPSSPSRFSFAACRPK